jgi:hypothetical protein
MEKMGAVDNPRSTLCSMPAESSKGRAKGGGIGVDKVE